MRMIARSHWLLLSLVFGFCSLNTIAPADPAPPLILGIHPYLPATELQTRFRPLADYLGKTLGQSVQVRVGLDYDEHIQAVGSNIVDIAFLGPVSYVILVNSYGPRPLLARIAVNGKPELFGAIVVRADSPYHRLTDLKGHRFAFGDPDSTMSHVVPTGMLIKAGVPLSALSEYKFLGGHKNVAFGVLSGDFDAGAVKMEVYKEYAGRGLRLLAESPAVSEHLLVARPDMPAGQIEKLRRALLDLNNRPESKQIMPAINKDMTAFVPVIDADYDSLRALLHPNITQQ